MTWSAYALVEYLYGIRQIVNVKDDGSTEEVTEQVEKYKWGDKEIPAGFFSQPDAEHISAVIANPSGTFAKFDRMGFLAGFGDRRIQMFREGMCFREADVPEEFSDEVHSSEYTETWVEGLSVYHNPRAIYPLPIEFIPGAAHFNSDGVSIMSFIPPFHPIGSLTLIISPR